MSDGRVVVLGDVMLDVVVKPEAVIAPTSDTPSRVRIGRGGAAANMAEVLARSGFDVTYVGARGDDLAARLFEDTLGLLGVDLELELVEGTTGVVVAVVDGAGQRAMMTDRGANSSLGLHHVREQLDTPFDHLHVSGYTMLDPRTTEVGRWALGRASERGCSSSVDVCSVAPLLEMTPSAFVKAAGKARILFANAEEALALSGTSDVDKALDRLSDVFEEVVVTLGEDGARARLDGVDFESPTVGGEVIDTTGAGDAATGAYLAVRLRDGSAADALRAAMSASSQVVRGLGSRG